jgi:hypothetical protein
MRNPKTIFRIIATLFACSGWYAGLGQVSVSGPTCVMAGTTYQYNISGPWDSSSTMQACITGGLIPKTQGAACTTKNAPLAFVQVVWDSGSIGSLKISSSKGNAAINVNICSPLAGGTIDSPGRAQAIAYDSVPASIITCSVSTGGSCAPSYTYQWQKSLDIVSWSDIPGATSRNLQISSALKQATYFRRKVTESGSGTIAYSSVAFVDVGAPPSISSVRISVPVEDAHDLAWNSSSLTKSF